MQSEWWQKRAEISHFRPNREGNHFQKAYILGGYGGCDGGRNSRPSQTPSLHGLRLFRVHGRPGHFGSALWAAQALFGLWVQALLHKIIKCITSFGGE